MEDITKYLTEFGVGFGASLTLFIVVIWTLRRFGVLDGTNKKPETDDLKEIRKQLDKIEEKLEKIENETSTLYEWHNVQDLDGVKIWYVKRSLEQAVKSLTETIASFSELLKEWILRQESLTELVKEIKEKMNQKE